MPDEALANWTHPPNVHDRDAWKKVGEPFVRLFFLVFVVVLSLSRLLPGMILMDWVCFAYPTAHSL